MAICHTTNHWCQNMSEPSPPQTADNAVRAFIALFVLALVLRGVDVMDQDRSSAIFKWIIAAAISVFDYFYVSIRKKLGSRFTATAALVATDFRWWTTAIIAVLLYPMLWQHLWPSGGEGALMLIAGAAIGAALLRGYSIYRWRRPGENSPMAALPAAPHSETKIFPPLPPTLQAGLYVCDMRFTFDSLQNDRRSELQMRVFNGTGRVVEFSNVSGQIKFNATYNPDPSRAGTLPTPSLRPDTIRTVGQLEERFLILDQRAPAVEADKLLAMLDADISIRFYLSGLNIDVFAKDDRGNVDRLKLWEGVSCTKGLNFGQIIALTGRS